MLAPRVKESTTTATNGDLTLAGASTNFVTLSSQFELQHPIEYWIIDDTNNVWENGLGYLSATTTLVREVVLANSAGTFVPLTLAAGTKTVIVSPAAAGMYPGWTTIFATNKRLVPRQFCNSVSSVTHVANELVLYPFEVPYYGSCDAFQLIVNTAVAASKARIGFFRKNSSGGPGELLIQTGDLDTTTTGLKTGTVTAFKLRPGEYFIGIGCNAAVAFAGAAPGGIAPTSLGGYTDSGDGVTVASLRHNLASGWTTLASSPSIAYQARASASGTPISMIRFA